MNEHDIFLKASELTDLAARSAYLDLTCGNDAELRQRVENLLLEHDDGNGLQTPDTITVQLEESDSQRYEAPNPSDRGRPESLFFLEPTTRGDSLGRLSHYEILQVLGRGGFGIVLRAFDEVLQRVVAIKVLAPEVAATSPARKRFLREARSSAQIRHDNVVQVYAVEELPLPYIVMEFIPGETLQQRLDRSGPFEIEETVRIGRQIAEGLAAAHANDLIHRDIKPGNILLESGQQRVKITDFGLARAVDDASLSQSGQIAGTPMYMAPEQALGHKLDQRADLFSLGSVLYQMTSGRPPFRANGVLAVLKRVAEDEPRPIREIIPESPAWLCDIISKLHAKNPDQRYQSAQQVAAVLKECESRITQGTHPESGVSTPLTKPRGMHWAGAFIALAVVGACILALLPFFHGSGSNPVNLALIDRAKLQGRWHLVHDRNGSDLSRDGKSIEWIEFTGDQKAVFFQKDVHAGTYLLNESANPAELDLLEQNSQPLQGLCRIEANRLVFTHGTPGQPRPKDFDATDSGYRIAIYEKETSASSSAGYSWPKDAPLPAVAPFDSAKAKSYQDTWAEHLGLPVEITNSLGMKFRLIPPGEFDMGSTSAEVEAAILSPEMKSDERDGWFRSEAPKHHVVLTKPFYMGVHEVTQSAYAKVIGHNPSSWSTTGRQKAVVKSLDTSKYPVEWVNWRDAAKFCFELNQQEQLDPLHGGAEELPVNPDGLGYRLPTEAEWEFVCRAGTVSRFWSGNSVEEFLAVDCCGPNSSGHPQPTGTGKANPFGLFNLHGNVNEWLLDGWNPNFYDRFRSVTAIDPISPFSKGDLRVVRGGDWFVPPLHCRSSRRCCLTPGSMLPGLGFRLVISAKAARRLVQLQKDRPPRN